MKRFNIGKKLAMLRGKRVINTPAVGLPRRHDKKKYKQPACSRLTAVQYREQQRRRNNRPAGMRKAKHG